MSGAKISRTPTVTHRATENQTKSKAVGEKPTATFLLPKWGEFESLREQRKSRGNDYPCGKIKIS